MISGLGKTDLRTTKEEALILYSEGFCGIIPSKIEDYNVLYAATTAVRTCMSISISCLKRVCQILSSKRSFFAGALRCRQVHWAGACSAMAAAESVYPGEYLTSCYVRGVPASTTLLTFTAGAQVNATNKGDKYDLKTVANGLTTDLTNE